MTVQGHGVEAEAQLALVPPQGQIHGRSLGQPLHFVEGADRFSLHGQQQVTGPQRRGRRSPGHQTDDLQDFALVAQATTLASRIPFLHFFDGFRTSHELGECERLSDAALSELERNLPTIVVAAKGPDGKDTVTVHVQVDGELVAESLGGKPKRLLEGWLEENGA